MPPHSLPPPPTPQGESLPFQHTVAQLMEKLAAAGVGQRPVIFVCHRCVGMARVGLAGGRRSSENATSRPVLHLGCAM